MTLCKTWSTNPAQQREQREDRQPLDRLTMTEEVSESKRMSKVPIVRL